MTNKIYFVLTFYFCFFLIKIMAQRYIFETEDSKELIYWEVSGFTLGLIGGSCFISRNDNLVSRAFVYFASSYMGLLTFLLIRYFYQYNKRIPYYLFSIGAVSLITPFLKNRN